MPPLKTLPQADLFRTSRTHHANDELRVDRNRNVIFGASMMQEGDLNDDRPWTVDAEAIESAARFANQFRNGMKARFTHPAMSNDGMGSYLGRWQNVRVEGQHLRGDLHLAAAAFKSPRGDLGTYVLDLAEEGPEAFGVSLATRLDFNAMDKLAKKAKEGERYPIRFAGLRAGDIVDEPAVTRGGLFDIDTVDLRTLPSDRCCVTCGNQCTLKNIRPSTRRDAATNAARSQNSTRRPFCGTSASTAELNGIRTKTPRQTSSGR